MICTVLAEQLYQHIFMLTTGKNSYWSRMTARLLGNNYFYSSIFFSSNCPNFLLAFIILQENWMNLPWRKYYQAVRRYFIFKPKPYQGAHSDFGGCSGYLLHQAFFSFIFFYLVSSSSHCWSRQLHHLSPLKEQFTLFLTGFPYIYVTTLFFLIHFPRKPFKHPKGILLISGLKSVDISSLKWLSATWPKNLKVFSTEESFTRGSRCWKEPTSKIAAAAK